MQSASGANANQLIGHMNLVWDNSMWQRIWVRTFENDDPTKERLEWLRLLIAVFALLLVFATWKLWWPSHDFPQVPWLKGSYKLPPNLDRALVLVLVASLASVLATAAQFRRTEWALLLFAFTAIALMLLNQHRTQPWMYQFVLLSLVVAITPRPQAFGLLRLLTVGIYIHSGLSKLDISFCVGLGDQFWQTARSLISAGGGPRPTGASLWPLLFPCGEILIAFGLIWPRSRRVALWGACGMHGVLLLLLGPWGMNHRPGVLLWNLFFVFQDLLLFTRNPGKTAADSAPETAGVRIPLQSYATLIAKIAPWILILWSVIWPFAEPWGGCDVWLAWGLYAEHGEQLTVLVSESGLSKLPPIWKDSAVPIPADFSTETSEGHQWRLKIKQVALEKLAAPVYPANRFQLGVALQIADDSRLNNDEISAIWESPANRWTGERERRTLADLAELRQAADRFWWNAQPRKTRPSIRTHHSKDEDSPSFPQ